MRWARQKPLVQWSATPELQRKMQHTQSARPPCLKGHPLYLPQVPASSLLQVLSELLQDLWYDRLVLVGDLWDHATAFDWTMESIHAHIYFLSSGLSTTKFTLEEVLSSMQDRNRDYKHNVWSLHRMYAHHCYAPRLMQSKFGQGFLRLQRGDPRVCDTGACNASFFGSGVRGSMPAVLLQGHKRLHEYQSNQGHSPLYLQPLLDGVR